MTPQKEPPKNHHAADHFPKRIKQDAKKTKKNSPRKKTVPAAPVVLPECFLIGGQGSCPEWEALLQQYPMIDSIQREDFPDQGASFAYLAHFYRTGDTAAEICRAENEFKEFFRAIGYQYISSGNFESRWFEGVGVLIR